MGAVPSLNYISDVATLQVAVQSYIVYPDNHFSPLRAFLFYHAVQSKAIGADSQLL